MNPTDGSCWVADTGNSQVVHLSSAGAELWRSATGEFDRSSRPSVSVNPTDGSCWVADTGDNAGGAPVRGRGGAVAVGQRRVLRPGVRLGEPHG